MLSYNYTSRSFFLVFNTKGVNIVNKMVKIVEQKLAFYQSITIGDNKWVNDHLKKENKHILTGFIENKELVINFYKQVYSELQPRIVLCGINPGRLGAGKTGVPFLDYLSLSKFFPDIKSTDHEQSSQFVYKVIKTFGKERFFNSVYLTNYSWFGFETKLSNRWKNVNYFELSKDIQSVIGESFLEEMGILQPKYIIPLSEQVEQSLRGLKVRRRLDYEIMPRLKHPYYCSFNKPNEHIKEYIQRIGDVS
jgi:hypothetical protein